MKFTHIALTTVVLTVSACATTPAENVAYERITTKEQYIELVAGRAAKSKGSDFSSTALADGTLTSTGGSKKLSGTWTWEEGYFCREGTIGSEPLERDCQIIEIAGDSLKVNRNKGEGESVILKLK